MPEAHHSGPPLEEARAVPARTWARLFQQGEPAAVDEVRKRVAKVLAFGRLEIPPQERDDLLQETMTEIWQAVNRSRFDFAGGFWGFVEVVTSRRCIDWLRSRREKVDLEENINSGAPSPLREALVKERADLAAQILETLDPRCRELITLRLRDSVAYKEIARRLDAPEGTLRVHFHRCIGRARDAMKCLVQSRDMDTDGGQRP